MLLRCVSPEANEVMREIGIAISDDRSKSVDEFGGQDFDYATGRDSPNLEISV